MARIRSIKPEFWTSEQVMECSLNARLLFVGMWNFADDCGRLPLAPKTIKAQIFPGDDLSSETILGMIEELTENGLLLQYTVANKDYLQITGWQHQRIDKPQPAKYPVPINGYSTTIPRTLATEGIGEEGKVEEGKGIEPNRLENSARALSNNGLKVLKTDLREIVGDAVDVGLSASWLDKGYPREMILDVVKSMFARKPDIASLAYCEAALAERHAKAPLSPSQRAADASKINWDSVAALYAKTAVWSRQAGPDPESAACRCPVDILVKHGLRKMAVA